MSRALPALASGFALPLANGLPVTSPTGAAPAFLGGMPVGMELASVLLIAVVIVAIPLLAVLGGGGYLLMRSKRSDERDERVADLEREVAALRDEIDAADGTDGSERDAAKRGDHGEE